MGNEADHESPDSTTYLNGIEAIKANILQNPPMPKCVGDPYVYEVPGKADSDIQRYIVKITNGGARYIPGWRTGLWCDKRFGSNNIGRSMYGAAGGTLFGYPVGEVSEDVLNSALNPYYRNQWRDIGLAIKQWRPLNKSHPAGGAVENGLTQMDGSANK